MYFLKDIRPTPPISVHPYPNFCRIYPPKFPQIPTLLYSTIIKLYRKKNEHVNTKIPPLRRDRKPRFLYVRQNWNTKLQSGNSQNSHGSIALRRISGWHNHPKPRTEWQHKHFVVSKRQVRNSRNSEILPSTFPSLLHPSQSGCQTPPLGTAGLAEPQTKQRNQQRNIPNWDLQGPAASPENGSGKKPNRKSTQL